MARRSYGKLVAFVAARTGDVAGAEDALSDAFAAALADWDTLPAADLNAVLRELLVVVATHGGTRTRVDVRGSWEDYPRPPM